MFSRNLSAKDSLGIGTISSEYISNHHIEIIKKIIDKFPEVIFCGSLGLVINGLIKRQINDIDIITLENYYNNPQDFFTEERFEIKSGKILKGSIGGASIIFNDGGTEVRAFNLNFGPIHVDVFYKPNQEIKFTEKGFYGKKIRIEDPHVAINAKLDYIRKINNNSSQKHLIDLLEMNISNKYIIKSLKSKYKDILLNKN